MKLSSSVATALILVALGTAPVLAQDRSVKVILDCYGDPETVTLRNTGGETLVIDYIHAPIDPEDDPEYSSSPLSDKLGPGESITYESGPSASGRHVLSRRLLFEAVPDHGWKEEQGSAILYIRSEGVEQGAVMSVGCEQRSARFSLYHYTFKLTLYGKVPSEQPRTVFNVAIRGIRLEPFGGEALTLCYHGAVNEPPHKAAHCEGGGRTNTLRMTVPLVQVPASPVPVYWERSPYEVFHTGMTRINQDRAYTAWYDFDTGRGGLGSGRDRPLPSLMPETGGGALSGWDDTSLCTRVVLLPCQQETPMASLDP